MSTRIIRTPYLFTTTSPHCRGPPRIASASLPSLPAASLLRLSLLSLGTFRATLLVRQKKKMTWIEHPLPSPEVKAKPAVKGPPVESVQAVTRTT